MIMPTRYERAADEAHPVHRPDRDRASRRSSGTCSDAVGVRRAPHQALRDAADPHRDDVEEDAERPDARSAGSASALRVELRAVEARDHPVEHPGRHEAVPAERAGVDVADDPVGVVREAVDALDREQRPLERRHAVERDAGGEELEHRIGAQLVPAPRSVSRPLSMPPQLGAQSMTLKIMPSVCAQSGSAVLSRWCGPAQM